LERILIIGGGGTGAALAHDLTLRGFGVTLVEKGSLLSGTTGRHHGLLHSGARYALHDLETARECYAENQILKRLTPQAIEPNGGLFVALDDADMGYQQDFLDRCSMAGIPTRILSAAQALALEPALHPKIKGAVQVPDAVMDAWRLPLHFFAAAAAGGACILPFHQVTGLVLAGAQVTAARVIDLRSQRSMTVAADLVVNAAGPWAGPIAALAGLKIPVRPGPGVMVAVRGRLTNMVINRLQPAGEGDILVPQRNLTVVGTTVWLADDADQVVLPEAHVRRLGRLGARLVPAMAKTPVHAAWCASRPLVETGAEHDPLLISRGFSCIDHRTRDGLEGFVSVLGGKATTLRAMAREAADTVCAKTGRAIACRTAQSPLPPYRQFLQTHRWPGGAP
jgi:glycerol-3-phosphate dehydrogenase